MISSTKNDQVKMVVELRKKAKARQAQLLSEQERSASTLGKGGNGQ